MFSQSAADLRGSDAEVGDLDGVVLRLLAQLVIPGEVVAAPREEERDGGVGEVGADLLVRPISAVAPVIRPTHGAVALPVQLRGRRGNVCHRDVGMGPECRSKLTGMLQLEVGARDSHGWALAVNFTV
jgi:hypothetical protein